MLAFSIDQRTFLWDVEQEVADETPATALVWTPYSWSPDGAKLAGGDRNSFSVYSLDSNETVFQTDAVVNATSRWLDDRRVIVTSGNHILLVDLESQETRELYSGLGGVTISLGGFSPDKRTLYFAMSSQPESDIWLMTLPQ
jgi:Tol biopolymer transport system component